jgi:hypothetical protein
VMNTSFEPFHIVNTYGAFGSVGRERNEIIFEGTTDMVVYGLVFQQQKCQWLLSPSRLTFLLRPSPRPPYGASTSSSVNQATFRGVPASSLRITTDWTGPSGSRPWPSRGTTRGRCTLCTSYSKTIRLS